MQRMAWLAYLVSWMMTELECNCMGCIVNGPADCDGVSPIEFLYFSMNGVVLLPSQQRMFRDCQWVLSQYEAAGVITRSYVLHEDEFGTYREYDGGWWWR